MSGLVIPTKPFFTDTEISSTVLNTIEASRQSGTLNVLPSVVATLLILGTKHTIPKVTEHEAFKSTKTVLNTSIFTTSTNTVPETTKTIR